MIPNKDDIILYSTLTCLMFKCDYNWQLFTGRKMHSQNVSWLWIILKRSVSLLGASSMRINVMRTVSISRWLIQRIHSTRSKITRTGGLFCTRLHCMASSLRYLPHGSLPPLPSSSPPSPAATSPLPPPVQWQVPRSLPPQHTLEAAAAAAAVSGHATPLVASYPAWPALCVLIVAG